MSQTVLESHGGRVAEGMFCSVGVQVPATVGAGTGN